LYKWNVDMKSNDGTVVEAQFTEKIHGELLLVYSSYQVKAQARYFSVYIYYRLYFTPTYHISSR
jgi:hypothetical protein